MRAIVQETYGSPQVLEVRDVDVPAVAADDEVLVLVRAASLHPDVWHVVHGVPYVLRLMGAGLRRPKNPIPGTDMAGIVQSVGAGVTRFRPGDDVFGETWRGNQWRNAGAFAEFAIAPESKLAPKPKTLTFEEAAGVPTSGSIAVQGVRDEGQVRAGQRVLINGAAGGVGVFAVQVAKALGAHVTAVDAADKFDVLRSIGADSVIDSGREDFTRGRERFDVLVDIPGNRPFSVVKRVLTRGGTYVLIGHDHYGSLGRRWFGSLGTFAKLLVLSPFVRQLPGLRGARDPGDRLLVLMELAEAGKLKPVIDRTYPLARIPDAIRYLEQGRVRGKVVITIDP